MGSHAGGKGLLTLAGFACRTLFASICASSRDRRGTAIGSEGVGAALGTNQCGSSASREPFDAFIADPSIWDWVKVESHCESKPVPTWLLRC